MKFPPGIRWCRFSIGWTRWCRYSDSRPIRNWDHHSSPGPWGRWCRTTIRSDTRMRQSGDRMWSSLAKSRALYPHWSALDSIISIGTRRTGRRMVATTMCTWTHCEQSEIEGNEGLVYSILCCWRKTPKITKFDILSTCRWFLMTKWPL